MVTPKVIPRTPRILSIQSHVVSGYCGNKSVTLPLQLLEFEMDVINSVQLSNHTQYKVAKGQIFNSNDLTLIHEGLRENGLLKMYDSILTGYVADVSYIESMAKLIGEIKQVRRANNLGCLYTLDPVLGDDDQGFYVPGGADVAEAYKKHLLPLADIITPNRFEASLLSGVEIDPESPDVIDQAIRAIDVLHKQTGVQIVVITSIQIRATENQLICIVSKSMSCEERASGEDEQENVREQNSIWTIRVPKLDCPFTGTGDLFSGLLTGWLHKTNFNLKLSLENTVNTIHDILEDTLVWSNQVGDNSVQSHELRLVQNCDKIIHPSDRFRAKLSTRNINSDASLSYSVSPDNFQASRDERKLESNSNISVIG